MMPELWQTDVHSGYSLQGLHDKMIAFAESHFERMGKVPTLWMIDTGSYLLWIKTLWENETEKNVSAAFLRRVMTVSSARQYSFLTEAWVARYAKGETPAKSASQAPADKRNDVMDVTTQSREGKFLHSRYLVTLSQPKNFLGPRTDQAMTDSAMTGGRMWNLFAAPVDVRSGVSVD